MELKFYKKSSRPNNLAEGSVWFNPTTKRIELSTGTNTSDVYGSDIQDAEFTNNILKITKIDGSNLEINLSNFVSTSDISSLENSLASKLNKIKVNNSDVNSINLNIVGSGGTTVSNNNGTITVSSEEVQTTFDAAAITSGIIDIERLPKGALERLFIVASESNAMSADVQEGDTVQVTGNDNKMYFCVNNSATTFSEKFHEYTAGTATSVPWSGITGKPNIPTKISELTNDSGFITEAPVTSVNGLTGDVNIQTPYVLNLDWNSTSQSPEFPSNFDAALLYNALETRQQVVLVVPVYHTYYENYTYEIYKYLYAEDNKSSSSSATYKYYYFIGMGDEVMRYILLSYKIANKLFNSINRFSGLPGCVSTSDLCMYAITDMQDSNSNTYSGTVIVGDGLKIESSSQYYNTISLDKEWANQNITPDLTNYVTTDNLSNEISNNNSILESTMDTKIDAISSEEWQFILEDGTAIAKTILYK